MSLWAASPCLKKVLIKGLGWPKQFLLSVFLFVLTVPYSTVSIGPLQGLQESVWFIQNFLLTVFVLSGLHCTLYLQSEIFSVLSGCLSMPDTTSLHHCLQNHHQYCIILSQIFRHWTLTVCKVVRYKPSLFYIASVVLFKLHGCVVSHMLVIATPLLNVHKIKYWLLTTESI